MATRLSAMALPWPRSSASVPQKAPLGVHQAENRPAELLRLAHEAQRLAVALRLGAAEIAGHAIGRSSRPSPGR